jgi:flagellar hook protein FlgE
MFTTIYTAMTGLQGFAKGLDVISSNVANVNTPGYKGTELQFRDILYDYQIQDERNGDIYGAWMGHGVAADLTSLRFNQGDFRDTKNDTDAAIDGKGFFVVLRDGEYVYTRAGQFDFNDEGVLVTRDGGHKVMGLAADGTLQAITLDGMKTQPAHPTSELRFVGNLSLGASSHVVNNVKVIDNLGGTQTLSIRFTNTSTTTPRSWKIEVRDASDKIIASSGEIRFQGNGSPEVDKNRFTFEFTAANATAQQITLYFGEPGTFSQATSFSGGATSDLAVDKNDGFAQGSLLSMTFNDTGQLTARYSNSQTVTGTRLALANFNNLQALRQLDGGLFHAPPDQQPILGEAGTGNLGRVVAGRIELSNVELSQQFTDMIVVQRGYQASSQVLTVANEMMQQLLEATK